MTRLSRALLLCALLGLTGCWSPTPYPPTPTPVPPTPPRPTPPSPVDPNVNPNARVLAQADVDAVKMGDTKASVLERFGAPRRTSTANGLPAYIWLTSIPGKHQIEVWFKDDLVDNVVGY